MNELESHRDDFEKYRTLTVDVEAHVLWHLYPVLLKVLHSDPRAFIVSVYIEDALDCEVDGDSGWVYLKDTDPHRKVSFELNPERIEVLAKSLREGSKKNNPELDGYEDKDRPHSFEDFGTLVWAYGQGLRKKVSQ